MKCDCGEIESLQSVIDDDGEEIQVHYCKKCKLINEFSVNDEEYKAGSGLK